MIYWKINNIEKEMTGDWRIENFQWAVIYLGALLSKSPPAVRRTGYLYGLHVQVK